MTSSYPITLDARRRPTLPAELLVEAGLDAGDELVAYPESGRIVISTRDELVRHVRATFRAGRRTDEPDPAAELIAARTAEAAAERAQGAGRGA